MTRYTESDLPFLTRHSRQGEGKDTLGAKSPVTEAPAKPQRVKRAKEVSRLAGSRHGKKPSPNKTETECGRILGLEYPGASIRYEAITLVLTSGHRYTADWVVLLATGEVVLVEAKNGAYRHASYGRSKLAFDSAKVEYPCFQFQWREKFKEGWRVS